MNASWIPWLLILVLTIGMLVGFRLGLGLERGWWLLTMNDHRDDLSDSLLEISVKRAEKTESAWEVVRALITGKNQFEEVGCAREGCGHPDLAPGSRHCRIHTIGYADPIDEPEA